ncbi:hypothetical protein ACWEQD_18155 [Rhodococcus pyridinivorans]
MVARYYEVDREAVRQIVTRNRDELDDDGYRVVTRAAFESDIASLSNIAPRARTIALFPRRAVLRIGMLLRDSEIGRQVRDYLLDTEQHEVRFPAPGSFLRSGKVCGIGKLSAPE